MSLYRLNNVKKQYNKNTVLNIRDLTIESGKLTAVVGNSGSGKTTFLNTLGLITSPSSGSLYFNNEDLIKVSKRRIEKYYQRDIDVIFQEYNLIENLTVVENLMILKRINKQISIELIRNTLTELNINHLETQTVNKLSGGEMQRVAIARSLLKSTNVILADEPTGALDIENTDAVMSIFQLLVNNGKSIVYVTHDLNCASLADNIVVISDGQVIATLEGKKHETVKRLETIFLDIERGEHVQG